MASLVAAARLMLIVDTQTIIAADDGRIEDGLREYYHLSADDTSDGGWWYGRLMGAGEFPWALELRRRGSTAVEIHGCLFVVLLFVCVVLCAVVLF